MPKDSPSEYRKRRPQPRWVPALLMAGLILYLCAVGLVLVQLIRP